MHDTDSGATADRDTDEGSDVVQVTFCEAGGTVEGVNPDDHLVLKELIRKFVVVEIGLRCGHPINLLQLLKVDSIAVLLPVVVVHEHLLRDRVLCQLVRLDKGPPSVNHASDFILFPDDSSAGVELFQVVDDGVLDVDICLCEDIHGARAFH